MKFITVFVTLGLLCLFMPVVHAGQQESQELQLGTAAPIFFMGTYNPVASGMKRVFLDKLVGDNVKNSKKLVLLSFFEIDCKPCKKELPFLQKLYDKYKDKGLAVVVVNCDHNKEKIQQAKDFIKKSGFTFPVLKDRFQALQRRYHIRSFPTMFFIDAQGKIANVRIGYNEEKRPFPMEKLHKLLGIKSGPADSPSP